MAPEAATVNLLPSWHHHLLGFLDECLPVPPVVPEALEDDADVIADGELIVELAARARRLHH